MQEGASPHGEAPEAMISRHLARVDPAQVVAGAAT